MAKNDSTETPAPTFDAVPVADLPSGTKVVQPETIALGKTILAIIGNGTDAANESTVHAEKKAATARAAVLKRAINAAGVPDGFKASTRIVGVDGGYRVAALLTPVKSDDAAEPAAAE